MLFVRCLIFIASVEPNLKFMPNKLRDLHTKGPSLTDTIGKYPNLSTTITTTINFPGRNEACRDVSTRRRRRRRHQEPHANEFRFARCQEMISLAERQRCAMIVYEFENVAGV